MAGSIDPRQIGEWEPGDPSIMLQVRRMRMECGFAIQCEGKQMGFTFTDGPQAITLVVMAKILREMADWCDKERKA